MNIFLKALLAGALTVAAALPAAAQVRVGIYAGAPAPYYVPGAQVRPRFVAGPGYAVQPPMYIDSGRHARWREEQWRRAEWQRREEWRRHQWRRDHWQHGHRHMHYERDWNR
ncbi:MAG: hypothetical protein QFF03_06595 [Pseudomonadota bacterium]|nr:hypothetical protein [Pseudomonadota bacterium]